MKKYLFFDTETTGLPPNFKIPRHFFNYWPRLVQLSWIFTDEKGNHIKEADHIIKPEGFTIPIDASDIHGITTSMAFEKGDDLASVIDEFLIDFKAADELKAGMPTTFRCGKRAFKLSFGLRCIG